MKVKVNMREFIEENADHPDNLLAHASVDVDDLFETNCIPEEQEIDVDLDELLAENRQIAHIWGTDDVRQIRPDLDDDEAWAVLQIVADRLDSNIGITRDTVKINADELYPEKRERHWQGRIDVRITDTDGYGDGEVLTRLRDMAQLLAKDRPDVEADVDAGSVRLLGPNDSTNQPEAPHEA
jgi:hypothetical protein